MRRALATAMLVLAFTPSPAQSPEARKWLPRGAQRLTTKRCQIYVPARWSILQRGAKFSVADGAKMWASVEEEGMTRSQWDSRRAKLKESNKAARIVEDSELMLLYTRSAPDEALRYYFAQFHEPSPDAGYVCRGNVVIKAVKDLPALRDAAENMIYSVRPID